MGTGTKTKRVRQIVADIQYAMANETLGTIQYVEHEREERFRENDDTSVVSQLKGLKDLDLQDYEEDLARLAVEQFEGEAHMGAHFKRTLQSGVGVTPKSWLIQLVPR